MREERERERAERRRRERGEAVCLERAANL